MVGGAEGQAKVKEMLVPFIVGCIIVFGGFGLWKIAITVGNSLESTSPYQPDYVAEPCPRCRTSKAPVNGKCPDCGQPR